MAVTDLTGTKWLLPEDLNSTSYIAGDFDIDISPYKIELNTLLKLQYSSGELDSITTWEGLLDIAPYLITDIGGTNVVNNLVVENDKNNYLIVPTRGYLQIYQTTPRLYYGLDLASADNLPVVSGTLTFEHPIDGTVSLNFLELFDFFFIPTSFRWSEIPILVTIADPLFSTMTITGGDDVTNPTLIAWLEANATLIPPSIADKLQDLIDIKQDIKEAIENKDVDLTSVDFGGYAEKIDEIPLPKEEQEVTVDGFIFSSGDVVVTPSTGKVMTKVTVVKDNNLVPENIVKNVNIFGVVGTAETVVELTQAQYDALPVYDNNTYYLIVEE